MFRACPVPKASCGWTMRSRASRLTSCSSRSRVSPSRPRPMATTPWCCSSASRTGWSCSTSRCPGRRGLDLFQAIRAIDHGMPVVMVTKSEEPETLKDAIGAEISDYLIKPVNRARSCRWSPGCSRATGSGSSGSPETLPPASASSRPGAVARWPGASGSSWWSSWPNGRCGWARPTSRDFRTRCAPCRTACARTSPATCSGTTPAGCTRATATGRRCRWTSAPNSSGRCSTCTAGRCWWWWTASGWTSGP